MDRASGTAREFHRALANARAGHPAGFEYLWHRFSRQVISFARLRGSDDPDGITNEVFLGAFRSIDRFEGDEDAFVAYLFTILRARVTDEHRKRSRQVIQAPLAEHDPTGGNVEQDAFTGLSEATRDAIAGLTDEQRELIFLRIIADLPLDHVARLTGRTVGATKSMQHRALAAMRQQISREAVSK